MIPLQMELGGKDACIVLEDADLDLVAANLVKGGYSYKSLKEDCIYSKLSLAMLDLEHEILTDQLLFSFHRRYNQDGLKLCFFCFSQWPKMHSCESSSRHGISRRCCCGEGES